MRDPIRHLRKTYSEKINIAIFAGVFTIPMIYLLIAGSGFYVYLACAGMFSIGCMISFLLSEWYFYGPFKYSLVINEKHANEVTVFCVNNAKQKWRAFDPIIAQTACDYVFTFKSEQDAATVKMMFYPCL